MYFRLLGKSVPIIRCWLKAQRRLLSAKKKPLGTPVACFFMSATEFFAFGSFELCLLLGLISQSDGKRPRYEPETNEWKKGVASLSESKHDVAVAELGGYLYCVGGYNGLVCLNTVERYDPELNRWQKMAPMNRRRKGLGLAVLDGFLYAVGGSDGFSSLYSVERYHPLEDRWTLCPPLRSCRKDLGCAAFRGKVYAVGGRDDVTELCSAECFDPLTNRWTPVMPIKSKRSKISLAAINGYLLAVGGYDGLVHVTTVEAFDSDIKAWRRFGNMQTRHPGGGVTVVKMAPENTEFFGSHRGR